MRTLHLSMSSVSHGFSFLYVEGIVAVFAGCPAVLKMRLEDCDHEMFRV